MPPPPHAAALLAPCSLGWDQLLAAQSPPGPCRCLTSLLLPLLLPLLAPRLAPGPAPDRCPCSLGCPCPLPPTTGRYLLTVGR